MQFFIRKKLLLLVFGIVFFVPLVDVSAQVVSPNQEWVARYNDSRNSEYATPDQYNTPVKVVADSTGNSYVTGFSGNGANHDYTTVKYDTDGRQLWVAHYDNGGEDIPNDITVDYAGNVYVTGSSANSLDNDSVTVKYDINGVQLWVARYDNGGEDRGRFLVVDDIGNVYVAGSSVNNLNNTDYFTVKYDNSGTQLWMSYYSNGRVDEVMSLAVDGGGNVYVTGSSYNNKEENGTYDYSDYDYATIKYSTSGVQLWVARYDGGSWDYAGSLSIDTSGNVYVTGWSTQNEFDYDYVTIKYNTNGVQLWLSRYDNGGEDYARDIFTDTLGYVYVAGSSMNGLNSDVATIKYNTNGAQLWAARYDNGSNDVGSALSFDATGNLYVTGDSGNGLDNDYATVKYDSSGTQLWAARYDNGGDDHAMSVTVDNLGNTYVTGWSSNGIGFDYATLKYTASSKILNSFFSQLQNASNIWNIRQTAGIKIHGTQTNKPDTDIIKKVPVGWALKVATTTDTTTGNPIEADGYRWYGVIDVTDNTVGWMAAKKIADGTIYLDYDQSKQVELQNKSETQLDTKEKRTPSIIDAVNNYHTKDNTDVSLYGGGGGLNGNNNFQTFIQGSIFPKELFLAVSAQESGGYDFNNEQCSTAKDGGVGIMQITSSGYKGLGSGLDNILHKSDCTAGWIGNLSKYYSNALQGIYASIKDGFRVFQDKYRVKCPKDSIVVDGYIFTCQDIEKVLNVWAYNGFIKDKNGNYIWHYLKNVSDKLANLGNYFAGISYGNTDNLVEKLAVADAHKQIIKAYSPIEFQVIDSQGAITGVVNGQTKEEIPNSLYDKEQEAVVIFFQYEPYKYKVVGTSNGIYGLDIYNEDGAVETLFNARDLSITAGEIHEYSVDWPALARGERGVTIKIDYNGDGVFDQTIISDSELRDIELPKITAPVLNTDYLLNSSLQFQFSATDSVSDISSVSATLNGVAVSNNQTVALTKLGVNTLKITAIDNDGNVATSTQAFNVIYSIEGFLKPIKMDGTGIYEQEEALPVKFKLKDVNGKYASTSVAYLYVAKIDNGIVGIDQIPQSSSKKNIGNQFRYDKEEKQYIYNLDTEHLAVGQWQLKAVLDSGQEIKTTISLRKEKEEKKDGKTDNKTNLDSHSSIGQWFDGWAAVIKSIF